MAGGKVAADLGSLGPGERRVEHHHLGDQPAHEGVAPLDPAQPEIGGAGSGGLIGDELAEFTRAVTELEESTDRLLVKLHRLRQRLPESPGGAA